MKSATIWLTNFLMRLLQVSYSGVFVTLLLYLKIGVVYANNNVLNGCTGATQSSTNRARSAHFACDQLLIHTWDGAYSLTNNDANAFWCGYLATPKIISTVGIFSRLIVWEIDWDQ